MISKIKVEALIQLINSGKISVEDIKNPQYKNAVQEIIQSSVEE